MNCKQWFHEHSLVCKRIVSGLAVVIVLAALVIFATLSGPERARTEIFAQPIAAEEEPPAPAEPVYSCTHAPYITAGEFFYPDALCTRAEAAQILARVLELPPATVEFTDVDPQAPYAEAVYAAAGLFGGYEDGTFRPERQMTKVELLTILCRELGVEGTTCTFIDVQEADWHFVYSAGAQEQGWLDYLPTARLGPRDPLTKAELVMILNRALGRYADRNVIDALAHDYYLDISPEHIAYYDILEATLAHNYEPTEDRKEDWQAESLPETLLKPGFYQQDSRKWHVSEDYKVDRKAGLLDLYGQTYLVLSDGSIAADGALHTLGDEVVFATVEGPILKNAQWHDFTFDAEGFYTSGVAVIDDYVNQIISECTTKTMSPTEKLRACFDYVRAYGYMGRNSVITDKYMPYERALGYAQKIYETGKGDCYNFAAAFYFLARQLGFDARAALGTCQYYWNAAPIAHGWVEMDAPDGTKIYDPQIENYNLRSGISNDACGAFGVSYKRSVGRYYQN